MHTTLLSSFLKRVATGCPCQERHGASVADTPPVRVGLLASADSNKVAVKYQVLLTSRDFAVADAWCFGNLPMVRARTAVDRGLGLGRERVPMSSKILSWDKRCTCCATEHLRMSDSALFVCSSFIVTHCYSMGRLFDYKAVMNLFQLSCYSLWEDF